MKLLKVQFPRLVQLPGLAEPIHSLGKPDIDFNFRMRNSTFPVGQCATSVLQQRHPDFSGCFTASIALHHWLSKQTDVPVKSSYHDYIGEGNTPLLAVQANGRVSLSRLFYPSFYDWQSS